jgi:hypothetical protein
MPRKLMAHYLDSSFGGATASWYRLGKDLEEFNVEMNPDVEQFRNILGENNINHNGYEVSADSEPFYAREGDALFEKLQEEAERVRGFDSSEKLQTAMQTACRRDSFSRRKIAAPSRTSTGAI